jgi:hypothetical protein
MGQMKLRTVSEKETIIEHDLERTKSYTTNYFFKATTV